MADIRDALKTKLESLTYNGESANVYDEGSTKLCFENMEAKVFTGKVGIFIGNSIDDPKPLSMGWKHVITTIDVIIAEKRANKVKDFPLYVKSLMSGIDRSDLDVGNIINVSVTLTEPVERQHGKLWTQLCEVTIVHYVSVNTDCPIRINVDLPIITIDEDAIDSWNDEGHGALSVPFNVTVTNGTGSVSSIFFAIVDSNNSDLSSGTVLYGTASEGLNSVNIVSRDEVCQTGNILVFYAVAIDSLGAASPIATYQIELT